MINVNNTWHSIIYKDENGKAVKRTPRTHPYNYDPFVLWRGGKNEDSDGTAYSDRLRQWDGEKHDRLCLQHFGEKGCWWNTRDPAKIEAFLRDYLDSPELKLVLVMQYCNQATGYPVWRFDYKGAAS